MKRIKTFFFANQLIFHSSILFIGSTLVNFGAYIYHLLMGRMLGPSDYGVLVALISLTYFISVITMTLDTVVVRFASSFKAKNNYPQIYSLFKEFSQKILIFGTGIFLLFCLGHRWVGHFLKVTNYPAIILVGSLFISRLLTPISGGVLRSFLKFPFLAANGVVAVIIKLVIGLGLVRAGFSVLGAVMGFVVADFVAYLISLYPLRFLLEYKPKLIKLNWRKMLSYAAPTSLVSLSLTSLYTTDVILVKHFFTSHQAGLYSALGMMGKIIFFSSGAIISVMFPLIAESHERGKKYKNILSQAILIVAGFSIGITSIYFLLPELMVRLLYGAAYLEIASYLGLFGIFITFYSLVNVLVNFFLSIHQTKVAIFVFLAALAQIVLICLFHSSIVQVIKVSLLVAALLLFSLLIYYLKGEKVKATF